MGILAHIIRTVNHRESREREGWREGKNKRFSTEAQMRWRGAREEGEKSIVPERGGCGRGEMGQSCYFI